MTPISPTADGDANTSSAPPLPGLPVPSPRRLAGLDAYLALWAALADLEDTAVADRLAASTTEAVTFRDPFNDLRGREGLLAVLRHSRQQAPDLRFEIHGRGWAAEDTAYVAWTFTATVPLIGAWTAPGMSIITLDETGRVSGHTDHWDAATHFLGRLPLIGPLTRALLRRAAA